MSFTKETKKPVDAWETPKETWEFVTVPDEDPLGKTFPNISLNKHIFEAGQTYNLPPQVAAYVKDRIKVFNRSCVRLLQPNVDLKAQTDVQNHGSKTPATYVDASQVQTA